MSQIFAVIADHAQVIHPELNQTALCLEKSLSPWHAAYLSECQLLNITTHTQL
uniref:Uncharacterized protein n=1 Tax=Anguilla anguilla TaxID=7936 RepID=A0A0E9SGQ3_ANGAN